MNVRTLILLIVFVLAAGIYVFFQYGKGFSSFGFDEANFAVKDTASISKVVLTRVVQGQEKIELVLEKDGPAQWRVNSKFPAFQPRVNQLLAVLYRLQVKESLSEAAQETAHKFFEALHTRVDVFEGDRLVKSLLLGTQTKDAKGSIMMLSKGDTPYVLEIPGVPGYLNVYFPMELKVWRENLLFLAEREKIASLEIQFDSLPEQRNINWGSFGSIPEDGLNPELDASKMEAYFSLFKGKVYAESFVTVEYPDKLRQLQSTIPDMKMSITYLDGSSRNMHFYVRPENANNYFAWIEGVEELLTVQTFVVDKFLKGKDHFISD